MSIVKIRYEAEDGTVYDTMQEASLRNIHLDLRTEIHHALPEVDMNSVSQLAAHLHTIFTITRSL